MATTKTPLQRARLLIEVLDREAESLRGAEYREFLEEISADVESKLTCLDEEEAEGE